MPTEDDIFISHILYIVLKIYDRYKAVFLINL